MLHPEKELCPSGHSTEVSSSNGFIELNVVRWGMVNRKRSRLAVVEVHLQFSYGRFLVHKGAFRKGVEASDGAECRSLSVVVTINTFIACASCLNEVGKNLNCRLP